MFATVGSHTFYQAEMETWHAADSALAMRLAADAAEKQTESAKHLRQQEEEDAKLAAELAQRWA